METQQRQQVGLLLLLVLLPECTAADEDDPSPITLTPRFSDDSNVADDALTTLVEGPLRGRDLLMVMDEHSQKMLDINRVVVAAATSETPLLLATQSSILHGSRPPHQTKGSLLTTLLIFHENPIAFLLLLADNRHWNPGYLVLFCLNPQVNITTVLAQRIVQRSEFLVLVFPTVQAGRPSLQAYTGVPTRYGVGLHSYRKKSLGILNAKNFPTRQSIFILRFRDFEGFIVKVPALCYNEPFLHYVVHGGPCVGGGLDALKLIADNLNFETIITYVFELIWSDKINGTWIGLLGKIMYEGQHLMINTYKMTEDGFGDFDTTYPHWEGGYSFLLQVPEPLAKWRNVLYPFSSLVWGSLFATMVIVAFFLSVLLYYLNDVRDPINTALKVGSGLLGQSMNDSQMQTAWARVLLIIWWVSVDILAAGYTSNLVAILTLPVIPKRIQTVEELAASDVVPCAPDNKDFVHQALRVSNNPTLAYIGKNLQLEYIPPNVDVSHVIKIFIRLAKSCGIINVDHYLDTMRSKTNMEEVTYIMKEHIYNGYLPWYLNQHTPYTRVLSVHMQRLVESGIYLHLYHIHVGAFGSSNAKNIRTEAVLSLDHLQSAFIVLAMGTLLSGLSFLGERSIKPY